MLTKFWVVSSQFTFENIGFTKSVGTIKVSVRACVSTCPMILTEYIIGFVIVSVLC